MRVRAVFIVALCLLPSRWVAAATEPPPIPLMINAGPTVDSGRLYQALSGITPATIKTVGRFTWDLSRGTLVNPVGDVVATVGGGDLETQLARVQSVLDKWTTLRTLERDTEHGDLDLRADPDDPVHRSGARVTLEARGMRYPYFTLFNLASDGTVNMIYPITDARLNDSLTLPPNTPYRLELQVAPPFGADHFIALASAGALGELHTMLKALDGKPDALSIIALFDQTLKGQSYQLGVLAVYTQP